MPRKNPEQKKTYTRKSSNEFEIAKNYEYSMSTPCANRRCSGFMFLVVVKYAYDDRVHDELECFTCRRTKKLGAHDPNRAKPTPATVRAKRKR